MKDQTDVFKTISRISEGLYKEKGSKFISMAYPVQTEAEIKSILESVHKKYYDARHHCYAYIIGENQENFRANDAGEPNHSAGDPILGQIRSFELTNALVVVVRYFGGTKLGVGGLISAYKTAAADALQQNEIIQVVSKVTFSIQYGYDLTNEVMRLIKEYDLEIADQQFEMDCSMELKVRKNQKDEVIRKFELVQGLEVEV